jgi:hypothetical protein
MLFFRYRAVVFLQAMLLLALMNGCQAYDGIKLARAPNTDAASSLQLMIKFKAGAVSCDQTGIARFSGMAGVQLEFVRPMSGDACVVRQFAANQSALERGLESLRKNTSVEWVEPDAIVKTQ